MMLQFLLHLSLPPSVLSLSCSPANLLAQNLFYRDGTHCQIPHTKCAVSLDKPIEEWYNEVYDVKIPHG